MRCPEVVRGVGAVLCSGDLRQLVQPIFGDPLPVADLMCRHSPR